MNNKIDTLKVGLGERSYDIIIGSDLLANAASFIAPVLPLKRVVIVTDENVSASGHLNKLMNSLKSEGIKYHPIILPAGESTKNFAQFEKLINEILALQVERNITIIALGGGVIGDITGFAASVILRGVNFIQIPTSLLAMVDSSVGGKTGINSLYGKNLIGSFYQPKLVLADIATLKTLSQREILAGYAEVVKYGLIGDADFFSLLESSNVDKNDSEHIKMLVHSCCLAKAKIVEQDERESGVRALLNLGHTFGHALEAEMGYDGRLLHGEAVSIGMVMAFQISHKMGLCDAIDVERVITHLSKVGLPVKTSDIEGFNSNAKDLLNHMYKDKKVQSGKLVFILVNGIGGAFIKKDVDADFVYEFLEEIL